MYLVFSPHWGSGSAQSDVCFVSWSLARSDFPMRSEIINVGFFYTKKQKGNKKTLSGSNEFHTLKTAETVWKEPPFFLAVFFPPAPPLPGSLEQKSDILMNESF